MIDTEAVADPTVPATKPAPVHPALAHVSIGAYVTAGVCDSIGFFGIAGDDDKYLYKAATYALMIATSALFVSILTGLRDRVVHTRAGGKGRQVANIHGLIMGGVGAFAVVDITIRRLPANSNDAHASLGLYALTLAVLALVVVGGRLGGKLVYQLGAGTPARR